MGIMDIKKTISNYTKIYRRALVKAKISDIDAEIAVYEKRLEEMYTSDNFKRHSKYPSTNAVNVYAVIAMFLKERLNIAFQNVCILRCLSNMVLGAYVRFFV